MKLEIKDQRGEAAGEINGHILQVMRVGVFKRRQGNGGALLTDLEKAAREKYKVWKAQIWLVCPLTGAAYQPPMPVEQIKAFYNAQGYEENEDGVLEKSLLNRNR